MSSLVTTGPLGPTRPYAIYDGRRTGDEFLEWNMGQVPFRRVPQNMRPLPPELGQVFFTPVPPDLDTLYGLGRLFDMGQLDALFGSAAKIFGDSVESIEFRSQVTPPIVINQPFATGQKPAAQVQGGTPLTTVILDKAAKPAMYIRLKGGVVYPLEPYGTPTEDYTGYLIGGIGVTLAVGALVGIKLGQVLFCPKKKVAEKA